MDKRLKDPIYGYIGIPTEYMTDVVDTAVFQRLRRILQTSYSPLYSSAIHNRFVHSLGVFYLGKIVAKQLKKEILQKQFLTEKKVSEYADIYQLACLLHDVGHAPFSHTGEVFYKTDEFSTKELHDMLSKLVGSRSFQKDIPVEESRAAAPHELMSCIIGIKEFGSFLKTPKRREFFSRCITGYSYKGKENDKDIDIKNCFISMLNSKVIDVDRLDYLIRDSYITGFESINIDYIRLLSALTIVNHDGKYQIAYRKDALSIIENVVYAHDAERKWIQNHPVVLYEAYLIQHIIMHLNEEMNENGRKLFSTESLSKEGNVLRNNLKVSLLCDDDIVYLYKNIFPDSLSDEFLERRWRRHPVWKSEAEYNAYIRDLSIAGKMKDTFIECIGSFIDGNQENIQIPVEINKETELKLEKKLQEAEEAEKNNYKEGIKDKTVNASFSAQKKGIKRRLSVCKFLNNYAEKYGINGNFIIIRANMFNSNFSKEEITKMLIVFGHGESERVTIIDDVCKTLKADGTKEKFYYLFYRRGEGNEIADKEEFCEGLFRAAII